MESHEKTQELSLNHFQGSKENENQTLQIQASLSSVPDKKHPVRYTDKHLSLAFKQVLLCGKWA